MNEESAIERITETENLTDSLEDKDANWLLDWGIGHVSHLIGEVKDEDAAGEKVHDLMAVMRKLNQIAGDKEVKEPNELAEDVREFTSLFAKTFGQAKTAAVQDEHLVKAADTIKQQSPQEAMQTLINLVTPTASSTPTPQTPPAKPPMPGPASVAPSPKPTASPTPVPSPANKAPAPGSAPVVPPVPSKPSTPAAPSEAQPKPAKPDSEPKDISMSTPGDTDRRDSTTLI